MKLLSGFATLEVGSKLYAPKNVVNISGVTKGISNAKLKMIVLMNLLIVFFVNVFLFIK